jgi:hypothetical protein
MAKPKVVYKPWDGATPESELSVLIAAYRYLIFDCRRASEKGASPGGPDDAERDLSDSASTHHVHRQRTQGQSVPARHVGDSEHTASRGDPVRR